jgi:DNA (cytosine-5)-methyltransferase 1
VDRGERGFDEPSATITSKAGRARVVQVRRARGYDGATRTMDEPSLAILGSDDNGDLRIAQADGDRRLTLHEAQLLQSFRPDFRLVGSTEKRWEQLGNATPPLLAAAVFRSLIGPSAAAAA